MGIFPQKAEPVFIFENGAIESFTHKKTGNGKNGKRKANQYFAGRRQSG